MPMEPGQVVNSYDLVPHFPDLAFIDLSTGHREPGGRFQVVRYADGKRVAKNVDSWEKAVALAGGGEFVRYMNHPGAWHPIAIVARAKALGLWCEDKNDAPKPVRFSKPGRPCEVVCSNYEGLASYHWSCMRPVSGEVRRKFGSADETIPACAMHVSHERRVKENDAKRAEEWAATQERWKRDEQTEARCEEVLAQIRPLLAEMGVHPDTLDTGKSGAKIGILFPPEVAEMLTALAIKGKEFEEMETL